jgi:hypothetical protein
MSTFYYNTLIKIFISAPYDSNDVDKMNARHKDVEAYYYHLTFSEEILPISPIIQFHPKISYGSKPNKFWTNLSMNLLDESIAEMHVLMLENALNSREVTEEIARARQLSIPIIYIDPETFNVISYDS